jgi:hypothetical protein
MTTITIVTPWKDHREFELDYFQAVNAADVEHLIVDDHSNPPLPNALNNRGVGFASACNWGWGIADRRRAVPQQRHRRAHTRLDRSSVTRRARRVVEAISSRRRTATSMDKRCPTWTAGASAA